MTSQQATRYAVEDRAAWITLDSPENRNALSVVLVGELEGHLRTALDDPEVRTIVLTGNGPAFCAGADLKSRGEGVVPGSERANPFVEVLKLMFEGSKPVIAAVNGHAFGGGIGLVAAADIAIAAEGARFSFSEVRLGLIPAIISVVVLQKLGVHDAMRLFLTGERFEAARAEAYGLVHRVVPADALEEAVREEAKAIALGGPNALAEAKRLIRTVSRVSMDEGFAYAEAKIAELFASAEAAEGMAAFVQKRRPGWVE
jgi:methylglutaconyl-CoA hydratase